MSGALIEYLEKKGQSRERIISYRFGVKLKESGGKRPR